MPWFTAFYTTRLFWAGQDPRLSPDASLEEVNATVTEATFHYSDSRHQLIFLRDGMVALRLEKLEVQRDSDTEALFSTHLQRLGEELDACNALALVMLCAMNGVQDVDNDHAEVTKERVSRVQVESGRVQHAFAPRPAPTSIKAFRLFGSNVDPRTAMRVPYPREVFDRTAAEFSRLMREDRMLRSVATISRAVAHYYLGNFDTSLVLSWFAIEAEINRRWDQVLQEMRGGNPEARISAERHKQLRESRDYTASVRSNILGMLGRIQQPDLQRMDVARRARNEVAHAGGMRHEPHRKAEDAIRLGLALALEGQDSIMSPPLELCIRGGSF